MDGPLANHQLCAALAGRDCPDPEVLGLPSKFRSWRPDQWDAVRRAAEAEERWVFVCAPTGFGKSPAYMANALLAQAEGRRTCILTSTKGLQDQLIADFAEISSDVRGMVGYTCALEGGATTVDSGPCHLGRPCSLADNGCSYFDAMRTARRASIVVTNYAKWFTLAGLTETNGGLGQFDLLICDEAHDAPEQLAGALSVEWTGWDSVIAQIRPPDTSWPLSMWIEMARAKSEDVQERLKRRSGITTTRELKNLRSVAAKLARMATMHPDRWLMEIEERRTGAGMRSNMDRVWKFDPLDPRDHAEGLLWQGVAKTIMYSATVRTKTAELLGLGTREEGRYAFFEYRSTFPKDRHPIITVPTVRMRHGTSDGEMRQWLARIDQIVGSRSVDGRKGVVHTVSYRRARYILANSAHGNTMVGVGATEDREGGATGLFTLGGEAGVAGGQAKVESASTRTRRIIAEFKRSRGPRILVTPSATTGYDFPYTECEYQIIGKLPFPDASRGIMKARTARDPDLPSYVAAQNLVQMTGRGMRAADDRCEDFIIDDNIGWFVVKYKEFLPSWWRELLTRGTAVIPKAPEKLPEKLPWK